MRSQQSTLVRVFVASSTSTAAGSLAFTLDSRFSMALGQRAIEYSTVVGQ
jgi:hypothetical protein